MASARQQCVSNGPALVEGHFICLHIAPSFRQYVARSTDFEARFREHEQGTASRTITNDPPEVLVFVEIQSHFSAARRRESQIKRWSRAKKQALIQGDYLRCSLSRSRE
jgi:putative endonuclease